MVPRRAGTAGTVAVGVSLAVGELLAGLLEGVPSPLTSVGGVIVDHSPPWLEDFAIATFGTADKTALGIGTAVVALVLGQLAGRQAARRFALGIAWFAGFGLLAALAATREPLVDTPLTALAYLLVPVAGLLALRRLLTAAVADQAAREEPGGAAGRRRFVTLAAGLGAGAVVAGAVGRWRLLTGGRVDVAEYAVPPPSRGAPAVTAANRFQVPGLTPIVVPNGDFYRIDTALVVPNVDPRAWDLTVTGMVDRELTFTLEELKALELVEQYVTIACVSNEVGDDLVGNAKWTGVRLTEVLEMAGVQPGADQIVGRSVDGWTAGFPTELAFDGREPLIALGMNDEPLPTAHGFPARLIVPGLYGYVSATKWLTEIELTTWDGFDAYWVPRGWAKQGPIKLQSRIDVPRQGQRVAAGDVVVAGVAWDPLDGISRVEVAVDGAAWIEAELTEPLSDAAWVQWRATVRMAPGSHRVEVRATNGHDEVQTDERQPPRPDGATGHHVVRVRAA